LTRRSRDQAVTLHEVMVSKELASSAEVQKLPRQVYKRRAHPRPNTWGAQGQENMYDSMIEHAKKAHWKGFLSLLDDKTMWSHTGMCQATH